MSFLAAHRAKLPSPHPTECLNGEIKRRAEVVGIFSDKAAIARLVGATQLDRNDEWAVQRCRYMTLESVTPCGLDTPEAYADYAQHCKELGFVGFKIHAWPTGRVDREVRNLLGVRARVGDDMRLMIDTTCQLRNWADALAVGRACDEANYFWFEDPYRDTSASAFSHRKLRDFIKTPVMIGEYVRGLEPKAQLLLADATDMLHIDPEYDMGITGAMKLVHFCEILGIDVQFHACGPAHRACISATRNTHMYEMALIGPDMPNVVPPVYACGYGDQETDLGPDGCVPVPDGPGLGVTYDWEYIKANRVDLMVFE